MITIAIPQIDFVVQ